MLELMGNIAKAIEVNNDILTMFKKEGDYTYDDGFANAEVDSFGPKNLKMVVSTLISNSQRLMRQVGAQNWTPEEVQDMLQKSVKCNKEALDTFKKAPDKASIKDCENTRARKYDRI